jgi:hypothetical protein
MSFALRNRPFLAARLKLDAWRVEQGVDERYCILDGIRLDEDTPIRDEAKKIGDHRRQQRQGCARLGAGNARSVQPLERHDVVLVVATKGGDQHIDVGRHQSAASNRDLLLRPSIPFRSSHLCAGERGSGFN